MAIQSRKQFTGGLKSLVSQGNKARDIVQESLISAVYYAESDGDVSPILRVVDAVKAVKSFDLWKVHAWLKLYAPIKPSEDGQTYVFDAKKRNLAQNAPVADFAPYEAVMRQDSKWYELAKKEPSPAEVWSAEAGFDNFIKKLTKEGYADAAEAVKSALGKLKQAGKLVTLTAQAQAETQSA